MEPQSQRSLTAVWVQAHLELGPAQWRDLRSAALEFRKARLSNRSWSTVPLQEKLDLCRDFRQCRVQDKLVCAQVNLARVDDALVKDYIGKAEDDDNLWCSWYLLRTARPGEPSSTRDEATESPPDQRHGLPFDPTRPDDTMGQGSKDQQPSSAISSPSVELSYVGPISAASLKTADNADVHASPVLRVESEATGGPLAQRRTAYYDPARPDRQGTLENTSESIALRSDVSQFYAIRSKGQSQKTSEDGRRSMTTSYGL